MKWWREARFGMFIHWGIYSVPAGVHKGKEMGPRIGEWIQQEMKIPVAEYAEYATQFNPVKYDADAWVRLAKEAGMKYIVITSKHHDGFAMFKSAASSYNIVDATPFKRDALKELAAACKKYGVKLGLYYSQAQDWHHAGGAARHGRWDPAQEGEMTDYIKTIAVPQVKEILTNYGPIAVLWWDTPRQSALLHDARTRGSARARVEIAAGNYHEQPARRWLYGRYRNARKQNPRDRLFARLGGLHDDE